MKQEQLLYTIDSEKRRAEFLVLQTCILRFLWEKLQSRRRYFGKQLALYVILLLFTVPARAESGHEQDVPSDTIQSTCPVMVGSEIDPNLFTIYKGKKIFFCCPPCKVEFEKNPESYLHRLPQFADVLTEDQGHHADAHGEEQHMNLSVKLIEPMGIITLSFVAITVALGLLRRKWKPRKMLLVHKTCGVLALCAGAIHAALVLLLH